MSKHLALPDSNRLSVLTAAVLLALALTGLISAPQTERSVQVLGIYFPLTFNLRILTTLLAAGLAGTGMDWLIRGHPHISGTPTIEHWLLPTLTTLVVGVPLYVLPTGGLWWLAFGLSSILLVLVFLAEYAAVEPSSMLYPAATAGLTALSYALFLILAAVLSFASARLLVLIPLLFPAALLVSLRALHLYLHGRWDFAWAAGIALVCTQLAAALHYWPLRPVQFGLLVLGPLYALTSLATSIHENLPLRRAVVAPGVILALLWGIALLLR